MAKSLGTDHQGTGLAPSNKPENIPLRKREFCTSCSIKPDVSN